MAAGTNILRQDGSVVAVPVMNGTGAVPKEAQSQPLLVNTS